MQTPSSPLASATQPQPAPREPFTRPYTYEEILEIRDKVRRDLEQSEELGREVERALAGFKNDLRIHLASVADVEISLQSPTEIASDIYKQLVNDLKLEITWIEKNIARTEQDRAAVEAQIAALITAEESNSGK